MNLRGQLRCTVPSGSGKRPYYHWKIRLNWPDSGEIAFGATGFTQILRAEPVLTEKQYLSKSARGSLLK